jgi:formate dehydrogenase gamma subunit
MSSNLKNNAKAALEFEEMINRARVQARSRRIAKARELASQLKPQADGSVLIQRFSLRERVQHFILIFSFTTLGFTGLMQTFSAWYPIAWVINTLLGGVDTLRIIHHLAAFTFGAQTIVHAFEILYFWFVKREIGSMVPAWSDLTGLIGMLKYNLGFAKSRPEFDRYSFEEKVEYWALWWGAIVMGITGVFQWFPALITQILPGMVIPMARIVHMLEAILAVLAIAIWHSYHSMIKERNFSIFTGYMTEHEMEENHPLEYQRILKAAEFLRNLRAKPAVSHRIQETKIEAPVTPVVETEIPLEQPAILLEEDTARAVSIPYEETAASVEETVE